MLVAHDLLVNSASAVRNTLQTGQVNILRKKHLQVAVNVLAVRKSFGNSTAKPIANDG